MESHWGFLKSHPFLLSKVGWCLCKMNAQLFSCKWQNGSHYGLVYIIEVHAEDCAAISRWSCWAIIAERREASDLDNGSLILS